MITLWRGNSYVEISGADRQLLLVLSRHLAVQIEVGRNVKLGGRYSYVFKALDQFGEPTYWASLLHGNRCPAGLTPYVVLLLRRYNKSYEVRDVRVRPEDQLPLWSFRSDRREYQEGIHKRILEHGVGVVDSPPRSGKTTMMGRAIDSLNVRTLVIAPSLPIVRQTTDRLRQQFGEELVARVDGEAEDEDRDLSRRIVVATINSALRFPAEYFDTLDMLIIDEFHHAASESYYILNAKCSKTYYRLCFTGTHFRTNMDEMMALQAICSNVIAKITVRELVEGGWLAAPRYVVALPQAPRLTTRAWDETYDQGIVRCEARNEMIASIATTLGNNNIPTLVLTRRRAHAKELADRIPDSALARGGEAALTNRTIESFRAGHIAVLVGTTVIGEGVDLPNAGAVVYASGGGASVQQVQSYFRPLTGDHPGKVGIIYDFKDQHQSTLSGHSDERIQLAERCLDTQVVKLY